MTNSSIALVDGKSLTEKDIFSAIDTVLQNLWETENNDTIVKVSNSLGSLEDVSGKAKSKLWFGWKRWWDETGQETKRNDTFVDMVEAETGNRSVTVRRYINVWKYIDNETIPKDVQSRRMDDLVKVASALEQGFDFEKEQWKKIAHAANSAEVREIIREVKGQSPRKSGLQITVDRNGTLTAWKDSKKHFVGVLEISSTDEVVQKAIQRIVDGAGVVQK